MFTGCIWGHCIICGYEVQGTKCALLNLHTDEQKICYRKKASRQPGQGKPQPTCKPKGKEKSRLAQGQDWEEECSHEGSLFTSIYAAIEKGGSRNFLSPKGRCHCQPRGRDHSRQSLPNILPAQQRPRFPWALCLDGTSPTGQRAQEEPRIYTLRRETAAAGSPRPGRVCRSAAGGRPITLSQTCGRRLQWSLR